MSLRKLPELRADRLTTVCAFEMDESALERWNAALAPKAADDATISMLGPIGADYMGEGVTLKRIAGALRAIGDRDVRVDINSPGGDFFEGVAIYNALRAHPRKVTVRILGLAASAASIIAMAGDDIEIGKAGFVMVHNAWVIALGNRHDLAEAARTMEPFDAAMASVYADRAGVEPKVAAGWMDAETWFGGDAAIAAGLATSLLAADQITEDPGAAVQGDEVRAVHRFDAVCARAGMSRTQSRALAAEMKRGTPGAASTVMQDADELTALIAGLRSTLTS